MTVLQVLNQQLGVSHEIRKFGTAEIYHEQNKCYAFPHMSSYFTMNMKSLLFLICNDFKYNYQQLKYKTEVIPGSLLFPSFQIWNECLLSWQTCLKLQHLLDTVPWIVPDINMIEDCLHPTSSLILIVCFVLQLGKIGSNAAHQHWNPFLDPFQSS